MTERKEVDRILTPEGRLINASLFIKDQYDDAATASQLLLSRRLPTKNTN